MARSVIMPKQGLQMTEGTITQWLVTEGGACAEGQPLFEMETDKLTITIDAPASGTLLKIVRGEGETVPITETIAIIGNAGENIEELLSEALQEQSAPEAGAAVPAPQAAATPSAPAQSSPPVAGGRVFISPRAKMLAQEKGLDIQSLRGSGPDGLIVERDVLSAPSAIPAFAAPQAGDTLIPFAGMRKVIAQRMSESLHTAAQTTHRVKVDMTEATRLREAFKRADKKISFNDIVIRATACALKAHPIMNASLTPEGIRLHGAVHMGVAVAVDNGLIVPVIRNAESLSLERIGEAAKALGEKAKAGKLVPGDYTGGTFTISNLGMFGLDEFVAIINPPESGILAVGKIEKQPVVEDDAIVIKPMMSLTLTYDHRVVDGAPAARFLMCVKQFLENPYLML